MLTNGWRTNGTDYLHRAGVAYGGLGANVPEDALYPTAFVDANGQPFRMVQSGLRVSKLGFPFVRSEPEVNG